MQPSQQGEFLSRFLPSVYKGACVPLNTDGMFCLEKSKEFFTADRRKKFTFQMDKLAAVLQVGMPTAF